MILTTILFSYISYQVAPGGWHAARGNGAIRRWLVNDLCNRVKIQFRDGREKAASRPQYEFQNGDHILHSMLAIGERRLLVTHNHGAFVLGSNGNVEDELHDVPARTYNIVHGTIHEQNLTRSDGWLYAKAFNGSTILLTDDAGHEVALLSTHLKPIVRVCFDSKVTLTGQEHHGRWILSVGGGPADSQYLLSNQGRLTHRSHLSSKQFW